MPEGDTYPLGEERRLFYVALTRARRSVAMFTVTGRCSTFLSELIDDGMVTLKSTMGELIQEKPCPACKQGAIILKNGRNGPFGACSNFPACRYKPKKQYDKPSHRPEGSSTLPAGPLGGVPATETFRRRNPPTYDAALFTALAEPRQRLAAHARVPAFVIFHDSTLRQIAEMKPETLEQMGLIPGLSANKVTRFGSEILRIVQYSSSTDSASVNKA